MRGARATSTWDAGRRETRCSGEKRGRVGSERVRARRTDDLEVMLREAYAHPAVEGVMLWGFWELFMSRDSAHLVNAEGDINEAGRRLLQLKEWLTHAHGHADENGEFKFYCR